MKKGIQFLTLWFLLDLLGCGVIVPVKPGVAPLWLVWVFASGLPMGAAAYARFPGRLVFVLLYGLLGGVWYAMLFFNDPSPFAPADMSVAAEILKIALVSLGSTFVCAVAYALGKRRMKRVLQRISPSESDRIT